MLSVLPLFAYADAKAVAHLKSVAASGMKGCRKAREEMRRAKTQQLRSELGLP